MQTFLNRTFVIIGVVLTGMIALCTNSWSEPIQQNRLAGSQSSVRHIILMVGDGMGAWHVDATRKYVNRKLAMESLAYHGYMTTFMRKSTSGGLLVGEFWDDPSRNGSYDAALAGKTPWANKPSPEQVKKGASDSAAAASAMLSGQKTVRAALNVVARDDGYPGDRPFTVSYRPTIVDLAVAEGMATGVVTSVLFQHATPAATVVKTQYRRNQGEKTRQMIYSALDVIMGCGHPYYDQDGQKRERPDFSFWRRNNSAYLADENGEVLFDKIANGFWGRRFVQTKSDFEDLGDGDGFYKGDVIPHRVFGLAPVGRTLQCDRKIDDGNPHDDWQVGGQAYIADVPDLGTMTRAALAVLEQKGAGFWLLVEGGAIDWAAHNNDITRMIEETLAFDDAVQMVIDWIERPDNASTWDNTLLIITADHECGYLQPVGDVTGEDVIKKQCWGVDCTGWRTHTNSLVPIYTQGPGAAFLKARFEGDYRDNTDIFKVMMRALGKTGIIEPVNWR